MSSSAAMTSSIPMGFPRKSMNLHRIAPEVDLNAVDRGTLLQDTADLDSIDFLDLMSALYNAPRPGNE